MDYRSLPIFTLKTTSPKIAREKTIKVFNDVTLQFYDQNKQKFKIQNLFFEVRTHRAILEDKNNPDKYFEIHFDKLVSEVEPILRGFFTKETYKIRISFSLNFSFELKNASRTCFQEPYLVLKQAFADSKLVVN